MASITPIMDDGMKLIRRKAKDTSKLERYIKKYDSYIAANGDIVSLYETKGKQGLGIYAKIETPWNNTKRVIKYETPDGLPINTTPVRMRETWNGQETLNLTRKNGGWVNKDGVGMMLPPRAFEWTEIPNP